MTTGGADVAGGAGVTRAAASSRWSRQSAGDRLGFDHSAAERGAPCREPHAGLQCR